ncbi:flavin reductase family protein [Parvibaculum sp.]|uniref:flavin reductase family protein n=1 Tax=Parvibaculum sp. TaxID=2024848 RepID=UPI002C84A972|nr:flavin reductase family protein [Parvibaculum sp.]HUD52637.1 flavin reductase family protein [Parvibaculum sp.]
MTHDTRKFRNALGCFTTGVAVITAQAEGRSPLGITVNSFASVSLDPPLVLWSLDKKSDTLSTFQSVTGFTVNVLREDHRDISSRLAKQGDHTLDGLALRTGTFNGCPALEEALAHFECSVEARHEAGDHIIMIGRVLHFEYSEDGRPLLYHRGGYQGLAEGTP